MPALTSKPKNDSTPLCSSSRSRKLLYQDEYVHLVPSDRAGIRRPLSPVRLRRQTAEETPPKVLTVKEKNEARARNSPFVTHMPRAQKEHYLYTIGSVHEPDDFELKMELSLTNKLSKIASPIKHDQNGRNLHLPRKVPTKDTYREGYHENCHKPRDETHDPHQAQARKSDRGSSSPFISASTVGPRSVSMSEQAVYNGVGAGIGIGASNSSSDIGQSLQYLNLDYSGDEIVPNSHAPSAHTLAANACATPASSISDLSDRDTMTPLYTDQECDSLPTHNSGGGRGEDNHSGIYGDFEDDVVSGGSINEDEYIL